MTKVVYRLSEKEASRLAPEVRNRLRAAEKKLREAKNDYERAKADVRDIYRTLIGRMAPPSVRDVLKAAPRRALRCRQSSPEEVEAMKADCARPFDEAKALRPDGNVWRRA